jgi:CheY-like chemotaxis protein
VAALRASRAPSAARVRPRSRPQLAGRLVAVLDDDPAAIDAMRALFATWRADVAGATTGDARLDDFGRHARYPDLIVADRRLQGGETGIHAIARLHDELGTPIPAIIVTGDTGADAARLVRDAGLPLLAKPVDAGALEDAAIGMMGVAA